MRSLVIALLAALPAFPATRTASVSGNWSSTATWGGASVPGAGDTVTINNGITVTGNQNIAAGNSGNPVYGYVSSVTASGCSGYTSNPTVSFSGGTLIHSMYAPAATAIQSGGNSVAITLISRGAYTDVGGVAAALAGGGGTCSTITTNMQPGGGTAAIQINGTGKLTMASWYSLTLTGDIKTSAASGSTAALALTGGNTVTYDSSSAPAGADGAKPIYGFAPLWVGSSQYRGIDSSACSAAAPCAFTSNSGGNVGYLYNCHAVNCAPVMNLAYTTISRMGDVSTRVFASTIITTTASMTMSHVQFQDCGLFYAPGSGYGAGWTQDWVSFVRGKYPGVDQYLNFTAAKGTETRRIAHGYFGQKLNASLGAGSGALKDFTITGTFFNDNFLPNCGSYYLAEFSYNLIRTSWAVGGGGTSTSCVAVYDHNYLLGDSDAGNPHYLTVVAALEQTLQYNIAEIAGKDPGGTGDFFAIDSNPSTTKNYTLTNNIINYSPDGLASTVLTVTSSGTNWTATVDHNTSPQVHQVSLEGSSHPANVMTFRSNSLVGYPNTNAAAYKFYAGSAGNCQNACVSAARCNYNGGYLYNLTDPGHAYANQGLGYACSFTVAPIPGRNVGNIGQFDVDADPRYIAKDYATSRTVRSWDTGYLKRPVGVRWANNQGLLPYGTIRSWSDASYDGGASRNVRCIVASGCDTSAANTTPLTGSAWRTQWEWASLQYLRDAMTAGTLYTDGAIRCAGCSGVEAFWSWAFYGFTPQNPAYWGAGHDGKDIGAVHLPAAQHMQPAVVLP